MRDKVVLPSHMCSGKMTRFVPRYNGESWVRFFCVLSIRHLLRLQSVHVLFE